MITLFCIIGNLRGGELPCQSFIDNFPDVDLALCVGNSYPNSGYRSRAKYIWELDESNENVWYEIFDSVYTNWREFDHTKNLWGPYKGPMGSGMIVMAFRQKLYQHLTELDLRYDRYVLTRADHVYSCGFLSTCKSNEIYIPRGESYGGITDRFCVADHDAFLKSLQVIEYLQKSYTKYTFKNIEMVLNQFYIDIGLTIKTTPRSMYVVARSGEQTRWRRGKSILPYNHNYLLKYPKEYRQSMIDLEKLSIE